MKYLKNIKVKTLTKRSATLCVIVITVFMMASCKKLVQVPGPDASISSANVFETNSTATAVLNGIYSNLSSQGVISGLSSVSVNGGLSSDELTLFGSSSNPSYIALYHNNLNINNLGSADIWNYSYTLIYTCNAAISGLTNNKNLTPSVNSQLLGEAEFMRAFIYFYLVNLYGDVPLVTGTDYKINSTLSRSPSSKIYDQIVSDLQNAQTLLTDHYVDGTLLNPTSERVRPTKWAATALLARVYLYIGKWENAEKQASAVINNTNLFKLDSLNNVFLKNSNEAIWQLQTVNSSQNTTDGTFFIIPATGPSDQTPVYLSPQLLNSFEQGDLRYVKWVSNVTVDVGSTPTTYYFPCKYKVSDPAADVTEYEMVFRLAEQYLIRAEAEAEQGNTTNSIADINIIRSRAGLPGTTASNSTDLIAAIIHERQIELFSEWGNRWFDLKRTGTVNNIMSVVTPQKGGSSWKTFQQLYPLSYNDLQFDPNLSQNTGY